MAKRKPRVYLTYQGETLTQSAWARRLGMSQPCLWNRRQKTTDVEAILGQPLRPQRSFVAALEGYLAQEQEVQP